VTALSRPAPSRKNTSTAPHRHSRSSRKAMLRTACSRCAPRSCSAGSSGAVSQVSTRTDANPVTTPDSFFNTTCAGSGNKSSIFLAHLNPRRDHTQARHPREEEKQKSMHRKRGKVPLDYVPPDYNPLSILSLQAQRCLSGLLRSPRVIKELV
jgi:hypothetical protein